jgi:hypothetical protein
MRPDHLQLERCIFAMRAYESAGLRAFPAQWLPGKCRFLLLLLRCELPVKLVTMSLP